MRFVLDTNLLVSGVVFGGTPRRLVDAAREGRYTLCTSETLLAELQRVLGREKFAQRLRLAELSPQGIANDLRRIALVVLPSHTPRVVPTDPSDDHVIAAALAAQAQLIASGDKRDLLSMGSHAGIPIVTATEALARLDAQPAP